MLTYRRFLIAAVVLTVIFACPRAGTAAAAQRFGSANLARGAKGQAVVELQRALTRIGFGTGAISGFFGRVTERRVREYQRARSIPTTGIVGPKTKAALAADLSGLEQPVSRAARPVAPSPQPAPALPPIRGSVLLTFNDSPDPKTTPMILETLAAAKIHAIFFCTGERASARPELVRLIVAGGHAIGVHGWSDADYTALTEAEIASDMNSTLRALVDAGASQPIWFRPPRGAFDGAVIAAGARLGLQPSFWSNIGGGPSVTTAARAAFDGATLLLIDNPETAEKLPEFLIDLREEGFAVKGLE